MIIVLNSIFYWDGSVGLYMQFLVFDREFLFWIYRVITLQVKQIYKEINT